MSEWYDTWEADDPFESEYIELDALRGTVVRIRDILAHEAETLGGRWDRVLLGGISQGASAAAHTLANVKIPGENPRLGAYLGFSGDMPYPN